VLRILTSRHVLTVLGLGAVAFGLVHHYAVAGVWFQPDQVLHHETLELLILAFLGGLWWPREAPTWRRRDRETEASQPLGIPHKGGALP